MIFMHIVSFTMDENNMLLALLIEEDEDDDYLHLILVFDSSELFLKRKQEGTYDVLVLRHLVDNDTKFRDFFRLTPHLFNEVLNNIKGDIKSTPSKRYPIPISPKEKLCLTLR